MTATEMAHELLWDFAKRAQAEEEAAYQRYRAFITASERVLDAKYQQHRAKYGTHSIAQSRKQTNGARWLAK